MIEFAAVLVLAGVLVWQMREHRIEQAAWRLERASLLQRIQAPEVAVVAHDVGEAGAQPPAVNAFDDEDYWGAQQQMLERIAQIERGGV